MVSGRHGQLCMQPVVGARPTVHRSRPDGPAICFLQPLPAPCTVCCTARLLSVDGRKLWSSVELADRPGGTIYASGKVSTMPYGASPQVYTQAVQQPCVLILLHSHCTVVIDGGPSSGGCADAVEAEVSGCMAAAQLLRH